MTLRVETDRVVRLSYELFDEAGELVESTRDAGPVEYVHGYGQVLPGLERGVTGAAAGDARSFRVPPKDGFGDHDPEGVFVIDADGIPEGAQAGDEIAAERDGETFTFRILELLDGALRVDANHPLAGQTVRFEVRVDDVRDATDEEIEAARAELEELSDGCGCGDPAHTHDHGGGDAVIPAASLARQEKK